MKLGPWVIANLERFLVAWEVCWAPIIRRSLSLKVVGFFLAEDARVLELCRAELCVVTVFIFLASMLIELTRTFLSVEFLFEF